jgi:ligand-binding sensor domain-containing protein/signal transduction histidine kinase
VNTARKPRDDRGQTKCCQRQASICLWAVYALLALLCATSSARSQGLPEHPTALARPIIDVPQLPIHIHKAALRLVDGYDLRFSRLSEGSGLSQSRVSATVQDDLGFLWFGTQYGLNRFDGYKFKVFKHEPGQPRSLSGVYVRSLFKDHLGTLWVSCDRSLDRFDPITETFTHFRIASPESKQFAGPVLQITEDRDGNLWLVTAEGLFRLDPATGKTAWYGHIPNDPTSLSSSFIIFADEDKQGTFWVANWGGLDAFDRETGKVIRHIPLVRPMNASTFHEDRFGVFWIARTSPICPLASLDRKSGEMTCYSVDEGGHTTTGLAGVFSMLESPDGTMWFATEGEGLLKFDRAHDRLIRYKNHPEDNESLSSDSVLSLVEDKEGTIWCAMHQTAPSFFSERPPGFESFTHQRGNLAGSLVTSIFEDRNKILWIGSTGALNRIDRVNRRNTVPKGVGVEGEILSIVEDPSGTLVAGTFRQGLLKLDPDTGYATPYSYRRGALPNLDTSPIMRLLFDHRGTLWVARWGSLNRFDPATGKVDTYKSDPQNPVDYSDILEDPEGALWLGGESGLQHFDPKTGHFSVYKHDPDDAHTVSDNRVTSVYLDRSGGLWLGTQNGVDKFDPTSGTFQTYYVQDGLAGNVVSCILEDENGSLWMGTNNGLSSFDPQTKKFKNYSAADGLPGPDLTGWSSCFRSSRGEMFFGGFSGATAFYPSRIRDSSFVPNTVLTDFRLSGVSVAIGSGSPLNKSITHTDSIILSHRQNIFAVEFSALSYFNAATNRYRYKLEGLDSQWHEVGSDERLASYTTLPAAKYTFRVQGATSRGPWSEPGVALSIEILPPWWLTWWFTATYVSIIILLLLSAYRYRLHQIARQFSLRLEERVSERTRLAREFHDTFLQTIQASKMLADGALDQTTDPAGMRLAMTKLSNWLGRATEEGRAALNSLRASAVPRDDLLEAIRRTTEEFTARESLKATFVVSGSAKEMHPLLREEIYRIGCEAIRNACMHSEAGRVDVELLYGEDFVLSVTDNGKGIAPDVVTNGRQGHFGLPGMRERAARIGGKFNLVTSPTSGTQVVLRIPGILISSEADITRPAKLATLRALLVRIQRRKNRD